MYIPVSYEKLAYLVANNGHVITWCGALSQDSVLVHTTSSCRRYQYEVNVDNAFNNLALTDVVRNGEADNPLQTVSPVPPNKDFFAVLRKASVLGITLGGDCTIGAAKRCVDVKGCVCGYDLELNLSNERRGGFPLPSTPVLSSALWCSCGYQESFTSMDCNVDKCTANLTSRQVCMMTIEAISLHAPMWLVGWNCYSFDNTCLHYALGNHYEDLFKQVKIGSASTVDYGYILDVVGVYNVDPYVYMQRSPGYSYEDLSLYGVAKELGAPTKTDMPDLYEISNPADVIEYNMNDSVVAAQIWIRSGLGVEIPSLAACTCAPLYDCVRYITGAMASCEISSEAVEHGKQIDWSKTTREVKYEGGKVLEPVKGHHRDVVVVDYSSMYPTIMIDARISPESVLALGESGRPYGDVWWNAQFIYVALDDVTARFPRGGRTVLGDVLIKNLSVRNSVKASDPRYAKTLKIASNTVYGCMGYENSPMYSPLCSASVTAIGRWCLNLACRIFDHNGMRVIYGDTDSCLVTKTPATDTLYNGDTKKHALRCLAVLHSELEKTPFPSMRMQLESLHPNVILAEKKMYCKKNADGSIDFKGMSVARRDAIGICKDACRAVSSFIMDSETAETANNLISRYICDVVLAASAMSLTPRDVSMVKKRDQKRCYVYTKKDGTDMFVPVGLSVNSVYDYSVTRVLEKFRSEVLRLTIPCGFGSLHDIVTSSDVWV